MTDERPPEVTPADPTRPDPEDHRRPDGSISWIDFRKALDDWEGEPLGPVDKPASD